MLAKLLGRLILFSITFAALALLTLNYLYQPKTTGTLHLSHARGEAQILREVETSIPHVFADSALMAYYTQGFLHAQERLWQMEKMRRITHGTLSEIFGEKALQVDKFQRTLGLKRAAQDAYDNMD